MTKQELIKMTGSEEQAAYAMDILLGNCKESFVRMAIQAELRKIGEEIEVFEEEGIIYEDNNTWKVNWGKAKEVFGNEPGAYWHATEEQREESERIEARCREAETLLYRKNRTLSLIAVR